MKKVLSVVKYVLAALIVVFGSSGGNQVLPCAVSGLLELAVIFGVTELLAGVNKVLGYVVNSVLVLLLLVQYVVMYFGGTYVSMIMLTNIHALSALGGRAVIYIGAAVLVLGVSFLPVVRLFSGKRMVLSVLAGSLVLDVCVCGMSGAVSPFYSLGLLGYTAASVRKARNRMASEVTVDEPHEQVAVKEADRDDPDVVVIFTEGLSQNIVDDERNIMPNVKEYEEKSVNFVNYFNHTAATYRGIPCQLHSGFQFEDMDDNGLVSLQDVFHAYGYETTLMNPEPHKEDFAEHLSKFGFDHFVNDVNLEEEYLTDQEMYEQAYDLLDEEKDVPQLIVLYTFETHVSITDHDMVFGDGSDRCLNKFYNVDNAFGRFMDKIENRERNTVVVFTTDHASYQDDDFRNAFPDYERDHYFCDEIPFLIYEKGMEAERIDVDGRTSLDMAPTVLDYLGMEIPDGFAGSSLFDDVDGEQRLLETVFSIPVSNEYISTDGGYIHDLEDEQREYVVDVIEKYCAKAKAAAQKEKE